MAHTVNGSPAPRLLLGVAFSLPALGAAAQGCPELLGDAARRDRERRRS